MEDQILSDDYETTTSNILMTTTVTKSAEKEDRLEDSETEEVADLGSRNDADMEKVLDFGSQTMKNWKSILIQTELRVKSRSKGICKTEL